MSSVTCGGGEFGCNLSSSHDVHLCLSRDTRHFNTALLYGTVSSELVFTNMFLLFILGAMVHDHNHGHKLGDLVDIDSLRSHLKGLRPYACHWFQLPSVYFRYGLTHTSPELTDMLLLI